jgi:Zn-dependent peptidase ImmA (M78 family)/DNA-binding XRE family transcriptional regulator
MVDALITAKMVRWARERVNMNPAELARKMNIKPEKIKAWEDEDAYPTFNQAQELAKKLKIPFGYLYLISPPSEDLPLPDLRTIPGTPPAKPSPDFLDVLYDALRKQQWFREYLENEKANTIPFISRFKLTDNPLNVAIDIQKTLGIDNTLRQRAKNWEDFLTLLTQKAEEARILVLRSGIVGNNTYRKLNTQEFRGFAISDTLAPLVFINGNDYKTAQIFTLVHELAHLWVGQSGVSNPDYTLRANQQNNAIDRLCDSIAADVLVPSEDFLLRWESFDSIDDNIERLSIKYRVSAFVILRRAYVLGIIDKDVFLSKYDELLTRIKRKSSESGGDFYTMILTRNSATFTTRLLTSMSEGKVLPTEAARLLNLRVTSLRSIENGIFAG